MNLSQLIKYQEQRLDAAKSGHTELLIDTNREREILLAIHMLKNRYTSANSNSYLVEMSADDFEYFTQFKNFKNYERSEHQEPVQRAHSNRRPAQENATPRIRSLLQHTHRNKNK